LFFFFKNFESFIIFLSLISRTNLLKEQNHKMSTAKYDYVILYASQTALFTLVVLKFSLTIFLMVLFYDMIDF